MTEGDRFIPREALARLQELLTVQETATVVLQAYLDGVVAGMGLGGAHSVDPKTGEVRPAPARKQEE